MKPVAGLPQSEESSASGDGSGAPMNLPRSSEDPRRSFRRRHELLRRPERGRARRIGWWTVVAAAAVCAVGVPFIAFGGPVYWFSAFSLAPAVAYTGDINVTFSATVMDLSGPVANLQVAFITYPFTGAPPLLIQTALTGPQGVATAHSGSPTHPYPASTLRIFAQFQIPGTSETVTSAPEVLQIYTPPIA